MLLAHQIRPRTLRSLARNAASINTAANSAPDRDVVDKPAADHSASHKLFADAAREESEDTQQPRRRDPAEALLAEHENWTGEESVRDAVLRMLIDKYKPLRGDFRSAEDKLHHAPPKVSTHSLEDDERSLAEYLADPESIPTLPEALPVDASSSPATRLPTTATLPASGTAPSTPPPASGALANVPLLPANPDHRPWHTTFKAPSHAASVRVGTFPPRSRARTPPLNPDDEWTRRAAAEKQKRTAHATRLTDAREATLDYRLGVRADAQPPVGGRPNPVSIKGWGNLVEERIEKARREGRFANVSGRGRPLERVTEERNPFIAREEFLMNRIIHRQGAAPPWVEIQGELETAANSFRSVLVDAWTRRALRNLTLETPPNALPALAHSLTLESARALRDDGWAARERAYHDEAVGELNALVRKYNGLAPYAVRRAYYARDVELARAYEAAGEGILRGLRERAAGAGGAREVSVEDEDGEKATQGGGPVKILTVWDVLKGWVQKWTAR